MTSNNAKAIDPVCQMEVDPASAKYATVHDGRRYYFCAPNCLKRFKANPSAYLEADAAAGSPLKLAAADSDAVYTCPMHPQVQQIGPGICPSCGMALEPLLPTLVQPDDDLELRDMERRFWIAAAFTMPVLALAMLPMLISQFPHAAWTDWVQFGLASPVVLWCGWPLWQRFWMSLVNRSPNMFTLIGLGTGIAYLFSLAVLLFGKFMPAPLMAHHRPIYFESAATITALVLLGQVLELRARAKAGGAVRALLELSPPSARLVQADGSEVDVEISQVKVGDKLRVRPGEKIPVDGTLIEGTSTVDESMITGEPYAVAKEKDQPVTAGTLNQRGSFVMIAQRVGNDTLLSRIVQMVAQAQRSQAPIQRLADKVSAYFVPLVVTIAVCTFVAWMFFGAEPRLLFALINSVSVMIIACPCALGLATPVSIMVGTGKAATAGILVRDAGVLETMEKVQLVALDKTGTLTEGQPKVVAVVPSEGLTENDILQCAAALEMSSEHPLAAAILAAAQARGVTIAAAEEFKYETGKGLSGRIGDKRVTVGTEEWMGDSGIEMPSAEKAQAEKMRAEGKTVLFVSINNKLAGTVAIEDPVKESTRESLNQLRSAGIETVMITGDNAATARVIGEKLGFAEKEIFAGVLPGEKGHVVEALKATGKCVAMAGDGVNDAVALAAADVGIAMGSGSDVAMESAGITLVKGDLRGIVRAFRLSRATMDNIKQNLLFAFVYNAFGILIATGIFYPWFGLLLNPMIASAAMSFSSVCVITNALRLRNARL